ncbi:hypothetical protein KAF25_010976, partial [Fusarium avenaceum]
MCLAQCKPLSLIVRCQRRRERREHLVIDIVTYKETLIRQFCYKIWRPLSTYSPLRTRASITTALLPVLFLYASTIDPMENRRRVYHTLHREFPYQVFERGDEEYKATAGSFWSTIQGDTYPTCFFRPRNPDEVSQAVVAASNAHCTFAVKSGGHSAFGASTIEDGLVIDLAELNRVTLSEDKKTAIIEPGGTWHEVYHALQKHGVTVPGGRQFGVGVGGLTLGGGISFFSNLHGWSCDNVLEYEVVLADGRIVTANTNSHKDLYWALRGGCSNFGIVTKFKFMVFEQEKVWTCLMSFDDTNSRALHNAYTTWGQMLAPTDRKTLSILFWDAHKDAAPTCIAGLFNTEQLLLGTHPKVFDQFYEAGPTSIVEANAFQGDIAQSQVVPGGITRTSFWTTSWVIDADMAQEVFEIWNEETKPIAPLMAQQQLQLQTLTLSQMDFMKRNGGNPIGLVEQDQALVIMCLLMRWEKAEDDEVVYRTLQHIEDRVNNTSKRKGIYHHFKYANYASHFQDPFA